MEIHSKVDNAEFEISKELIIRYKKGFGYWGLKEINKQWNVYTTSFRMNPFGVGFKENYGFGYEDLKPFFFISFEEALDYADKVDDFEYWEYNRRTHDRHFDTILRKGEFEKRIVEFLKQNRLC